MLLFLNVRYAGDEAVGTEVLFCLSNILMKVLKAVGYYRREMCFRRWYNFLTREKTVTLSLVNNELC